MTIQTRLVGWTPSLALRPVGGMAMTTFMVLPNRDVQILQGTRAADGTYTLTFRAVSNRQFSIHANWIPEDDVRRCATHAGAGALGAMAVRKRITRTVSDSTPVVGQAVKIAGTVYPSAATQPVYLQRWDGSRFATIVTGSTGSAAGGAYTFYYRPATRGTHVLRVFTPYDGWQISSASPNAYLKVG